MYVSRLAQHYVLKRMPMTASQHAERCIARHGVVTVEASHDYREPAIQELEDGTTTVSIDLPLDPRAADSDPAMPSPHRGGNGGQPTWRRHRLSLPELVDYLWKASELDWWHPRFEGRRSWAVVRALLRRGMHDMFIAGHPMATRVFVPEAFSVEHRDAIVERRERQWYGAAETAGTNRCPRPPTDRQTTPRRQILIAEVKEIGAKRRDGLRGVTLRHLPDVPFAIKERQWQFVSNAYAVPLQLWTEGEVHHLLCAAVFDPALDLAAGHPQPLRSLSLLPTTDQWQLVTGRLDVDRLRRMVRMGRPFSAAAQRPSGSPKAATAHHGADAHARAAPRRPASASHHRWP